MGLRGGGGCRGAVGRKSIWSSYPKGPPTAPDDTSTWSRGIEKRLKSEDGKEIGQRIMGKKWKKGGGFDRPLSAEPGMRKKARLRRAFGNA